MKISMRFNQKNKDDEKIPKEQTGYTIQDQEKVMQIIEIFKTSNQHLYQYDI